MRQTKTTKRGRPRGSRNRPKPPVVEAPRPIKQPKTTCPSCGSDERGPYFHKTVQKYSGIAPDGMPYTRVVRRWTICAACGQRRIDRHREFHADEWVGEMPENVATG